MGFFGKQPLDDIDAILGEQRKALRKGDLEALAIMAPRLQGALDRLGRTDDPRQLAAVKRAASENVLLLKAARAGLAAARGQRSRASATRLATYTADGRMAVDARPAGRTLTRR